MANYGTILVVDDNTSIFTTLEICLDGVFDRILTLTKPENILTTLEQEAVDIILLDMNFSHIVKSDYYGEGELVYTLKKTFSGNKYDEETLGSDGKLIGNATVYFSKTETKPTRIVGDEIDVEVKYNDKGLPIMSRNTVLNSRAELQWISDLEEHPSRFYQYEYDERGNWISRADRVHPDSAAYAVLRRTITYQK